MDATVKQAREELSRWNCEPAAIRARLEECLTSFAALTCDLNLQTDRRPYCPSNVACGDFQASLTPPGPALAEVWR